MTFKDLVVQLQKENQAMRLALTKEREVRDHVAALLAGPSTDRSKDPKLV